MHRIGVIPFAVREETIAMLFVTSQTRGRWILPKGRIKRGESHEQACEREAFEEAGVKGTVLADFPITVAIEKQGDKGVERVPVTYYPLLVTSQVDEFPERASRDRHWALLKDAEKVVHKADYLRLIKDFEALAPWIKEAVSASKAA